eukprot:6207981-Pleurochrysis_carterae.AAC.2
MDDKSNEYEKGQRRTTGQGDAHLLVSVSAAPSLMESSRFKSTTTSGRGADLRGSGRHLGRDQQHIKDKENKEGVSAVPKPSGMDMVAMPDVVSSCDTRPLEVKDNAHTGLLARVRGSPDPRATRASQLSRVGGGDKGHHSESVPTVHGSSGLGNHGRRSQCVVLS